MRFLRRNALGIYAVYAVAIVSGLVVTPVVIHAVGKDGFGVWSFIASITIYLSVLDFGVGPTIVRFAAEARGRDSRADLNEVASTGLALYLAIGLVTLPIGLVLAWFTPQLVSAPSDLVWPARVATALIVVSLALRFPLGLFNNLLVARQRWDLQNLANLLSTGLYAVLVVVLVPRWSSIVLLAALTLGTALLRLCLPLLWMRSELPELALRRRLVTRFRAKELAAFSSSNFLVHLANKVVFSTDVVVVGLVLGASSSGVYAVPAKLFALCFGIGTAATSLLFPAFAELEGAGDHERQRRLLLLGLRYGMAFMLLLALPLAFIPDELIHAWVGAGYGDASAAMTLLAVVLLVHQPIFVLTQFLIARALQRRIALVLVTATAANLVLSLLLAWQVGIAGVALSTLVTDLAALGYVLPRLAAPAVGAGVAAIIRTLSRPVVPALAVAVLLFGLVARLAYQDATLIELAPLGAVWFASGALAIWAFGLASGERDALRRQLRPARGAASAPEPSEL
jgi:O-antigen/teichoic acid export membrane protein